MEPAWIIHGSKSHLSLLYMPKYPTSTNKHHHLQASHCAFIDVSRVSYRNQHQLYYFRPWNQFKQSKLCLCYKRSSRWQMTRSSTKDSLLHRERWTNWEGRVTASPSQPPCCCLSQQLVGSGAQMDLLPTPIVQWHLPWSISHSPYPSPAPGKSGAQRAARQKEAEKCLLASTCSSASWALLHIYSLSTFLHLFTFLPYAFCLTFLL